MEVLYVDVLMMDWQWLYLVIICFSAMPLFIPIGTDILNRGFDVPIYILIPADLAILIMMPWGWLGLFMLHLCLFISPAPIGASIVAILFSVGCFYLWIKTLFPWIPHKRIFILNKND